MKLYFPLLMLVLFVIGCSLAPRHNHSQESQILSSTITIPNSLKLLKNGLFAPIDSLCDALVGKNKIYSIIDGTCMSCIIGRLNRIDSLFATLIDDSDNQMIFVLNVNPSDSLYFMRYLEPSIKAEGVVLWDNSYAFETANQLLTPDPDRRTFMVNGSDSIVVVGNPLSNPQLTDAYRASMGLWH